jgi:hypothetical protein
MKNPLALIEWEEVEKRNAELCKKGRYQHGRTSDGYDEAKALFFENKAKSSLPLHETVDLFRELHRKQPFLFLNGNTFSQMGRDLMVWASGSVNAETRSRVGHHIAGTEVLSKTELKKLLSKNLDNER